MYGCWALCRAKKLNFFPRINGNTAFRLKEYANPKMPIAKRLIFFLICASGSNDYLNYGQVGCEKRKKEDLEINFHFISIFLGSNDVPFLVAFLQETFQTRTIKILKKQFLISSYSSTSPENKSKKTGYKF